MGSHLLKVADHEALDADLPTPIVFDLSGPSLTPRDKRRHHIDATAALPSPPPSGPASRSEGDSPAHRAFSLRKRTPSPTILDRHRAATSDFTSPRSQNVRHLS